MGECLVIRMRNVGIAGIPYSLISMICIAVLCVASVIYLLGVKMSNRRAKYWRILCKPGFWSAAIDVLFVAVIVHDWKRGKR